MSLIVNPPTRAFTHPTAHRILLVLLLAGALCRVWRFVDQPSYTGDEAAVVRNIQLRGYGELLKPLQYAQAAPPVFLWAERGLMQIFGSAEWAMRAISFIAGMASLGLFAALAIRCLPAIAAVWAVAWFALSEGLIEHCCLVKPYSVDVLMTIVLVLIAATGRHKPLRCLWMLSITAAIAQWIAFPTAFVFGALSLTFIPAVLQARPEGNRPAALIHWVLANLPLVVSFTLFYFIVGRQGHDPFLDTFWTDADAFPPGTGLIQFILWMARMLGQFLAYPLHAAAVIVFLLLVFGGIAMKHLNRLWLPITLVLILGLNALAATLHAYPMAQKRLELYVLPIMMLLIGAGSESRLMPFRKPWMVRWWWVLSVPAVLLLAVQGVARTVYPGKEPSLRPVITFVKNHYQPGQGVYLLADKFDEPRQTGTQVAFVCYWPQTPATVHFNLPDPTSLSQAEKRAGFWIIYNRESPREASTMLLKLYERLPWLKREAGDGVTFQARGAGAILVPPMADFAATQAAPPSR